MMVIRKITKSGLIPFEDQHFLPHGVTLNVGEEVVVNRSDRNLNAIIVRTLEMQFLCNAYPVELATISAPHDGTGAIEEGACQ